MGGSEVLIVDEWTECESVDRHDSRPSDPEV